MLKLRNRDSSQSRPFGRRHWLRAGVAGLGLCLVTTPAMAAPARKPARKPPVEAAASELSAVAQKLPPASDPKFIPALMAYLDDLQRGEHSHGVMSMEIKTKHWTRKISMESWSLGSDYSLVRILSPKKEKGTASLKVRDDLFTYLAKTSRTIKISGAMMGGSWMGSHFTNDDLVRASRFSETFTHRMIFDGKVSGVGLYRFELVPKPDAPVVWGKIEVTVRKRDLQPLLQVYFDEDGKKVRAMKFGKYRKIGDRVLPTEMIVQPLDGSGEYTKVITESIDFNADITPDFFSIPRLKKM